MFKLNTFQKVDCQIVLKNQKAHHVFKECFFCTSCLFKEYFTTILLGKKSPKKHVFFCFFLRVAFLFFLTLNYSLLPQTFLKQWHGLHQHVFFKDAIPIVS